MVCRDYILQRPASAASRRSPPGSTLAPGPAYARHAVLLWLLLCTGRAHAQQEFFSSSPGALSASHESIDGAGDCNECHDGGRRVSEDKCLGCHRHRPLASRIKAQKGLHSTALVKPRGCADCHTEHKGRDHDLMAWPSMGGMRAFNHRDADWPLLGKHQSIKCEACHKRKNRQGLRLFLSEEPDCGACHKRDQPHGFEKRALMRCERCHTQKVWKPALRDMDFDHDNPRDAALPLRGAHRDVRCDKCHPGARFNRTDRDPAACNNCHKSPHNDHLFDQRTCQDCHSTSATRLADITFQHARRTRFALGAAHAQTRCSECHTARLGTKKPSRACAACHARKNGHKQRFAQFGNPPRCELCHTPSNWHPGGFDHDRKTRFDLSGRHATATCRACHRGQKPDEFERFDPDTVGCMGCHAHKGVHGGQRSDSSCLECHQTAGRRDIKKTAVAAFHEGEESSFPLVEGHSDVACATCHPDGASGSTARNCGDRCHEDSLHRKSLGPDCNRCHVSGIWAATRFEHGEDTSWPLRGKHAQGVPCASCHPARQYADTPKKCSASGCHKKDDIHAGTLGDQCERCHVETGELIFNHGTMSSFALEGGHAQARCSACHPNNLFKPRTARCFGCHPEPEKHAGMYGDSCATCHTVDSWRDIESTHDVGSFALRGAHDRVPCTRCHVDGRRLGGSGDLCITCHRNDDIHSNSLSPRCGECHTQWSFAPARFDHSAVGCFLTGGHRIMPCYDCHKSGQFGGISAQCYGCHLDAARAAGDHANKGPLCSNCHNPGYWLPAFRGSYKESICR